MEEKKEYGFHKLEVGQKIRVFKSTWNDKNYYKFQVTQKHYDGTSSKFYINLQFKKGVDIPNESDIVVKGFVENLRENKADKYNPIHYYQINDFELIENQEQMINDAYADFRENLDENEQVEISDNFLD
ncbi:MAG: hypothetical protein IKU37_01420 [Candidatus Gastranaerophilales bacterium]|nr:hypothetical protein [Candidatus Gastranaerophilales bacterium]